MSRKIIPILFVIAVFSSAGCRLDFSATSVVNEDGSLERTTMLRAEDESDQKEVMERYELPPGGEWKEIRAEDGELTATVYELRRAIPADGFPFTDYKRYTELKDNAAANTVSVEMQDLWVAKTFIYQETFRDVVDKGRISEKLNGVLEKGLEEFQRVLATGIPDPKAIEGMTHMVRLKYKPLIDKMAKELTERGVASPAMEGIMEELQREFSAQKIYAMLVKQSPAFDSPEHRTLIEQAFKAAEDRLGNELEPLQESIFGIHGLGILQNYSFDITVQMPGQIINSNADKVQGSTLVWEFDSGEMEQNLEASSRKIYPKRIALAGGIAFLLIILFTTTRRLSPAGKKKRKGEKK